MSGSSKLLDSCAGLGDALLVLLLVDWDPMLEEVKDDPNGQYISVTTGTSKVSFLLLQHAALSPQQYIIFLVLGTP